MGAETRVGRKVAVAGATGATGKLVVSSLLDAGHTVTVLASSEDRAKEVRSLHLVFVVDPAFGSFETLSSYWLP